MSLSGESGRTGCFPEAETPQSRRTERRRRGEGTWGVTQASKVQTFSHKVSPGTALVGQWLRLCTSAADAGGPGSIAGQGTKTPLAEAVKKRGIPNANTKSKHSQVNNKSWGFDAIHDCS